MLHQVKTLEEVKQAFEHWRATRFKKGKIPSHLWQQVKPLLSQYNISTVAQALNMNTKTIKDNLHLDENIQFIEVKEQISASKPSPSITTCTVELHNTKGNVLKIL